MAMAAIKVVSGKQAGNCVKGVQVKWGPAKKKGREDSELEDWVVRGKVLRPVTLM